MIMPGRSNPLNMVDADGHRYGFQGQELDDEIKGLRGSSVNYKYRMHDPRVGRFFARDPLAFEFPHNSPYAFSENRVIDAFELEGLESVQFNGMEWHDYDGKSTERIAQALNWGYQQNAHQGHLSAERVQNWKESWYVTVNDKRDGWNRSIGTTLKFYNNREDWLDDKPFKVTTERNFSQWWYSLGDGSEWDGGADATGTEGVPFDQGMKILGGTIAVCLTGGTIALAGEVSILSGLSLASAIDDMSTQADGSSLITKGTGISPKTLDKLKLGVSITSFTKGTQSLIKDFAKSGSQWTDKEVVDMFNVINDELNSTISGAQQVMGDEK